MYINGVLINDFERVDDLQLNGLKIIQDPKRFCFGVDAVLLSSFAKVNKNETVLDIGTGTGIIPVLLSAKTLGKKFIGLEIQSESVEMARRSVSLNNLDEKIEIDEGDIKNMTNLYKPSSFEVITTNPPYMNNGCGLVNEFTPKAIARHELLCSLKDIISGSAKLLKTNGRLYIIHRPHRLVDIICLLREFKLEPKEMRFVQPFINSEPNLILIEAVRNGKPNLITKPTLIIYNADGGYTDEAYKIYYPEKTLTTNQSQ